MPALPLFLIVASLMILLALAFILLPLWRSSHTAAASVAASNLAILQNQRNEIEAEFARGALSSGERDDALKELVVRVADEIPATSPSSPLTPATPKRPWILSAVLGILVPIAALLIYFKLGTPAALEPHPPVAENATEQSPVSETELLTMIDDLARKMEQEPNNPRGWMVLGRSQNAVGRHAEAIRAFERALPMMQTGPEAAQLRADYAEALAMAQQGKFEGKPWDVLQDALKRDPDNIKALALAGAAEMHRNRPDAALHYLERMKKLAPPDSPDARVVTAVIAKIKGGEVKGVTGDQVKNDQAKDNTPSMPTAITKAASVSGTVTLAAELKGKVMANDTLFILARAKEGSRMPLAVWRGKAGELPKMFELNDAMAMTPEMKLSAFPEVVIEARISKSGDARLSSGDLSGFSDAVKPGAKNIAIVISKVAP